MAQTKAYGAIALDKFRAHGVQFSPWQKKSCCGVVGGESACGGFFEWFL